MNLPCPCAEVLSCFTWCDVISRGVTSFHVADLQFSGTKFVCYDETNPKHGVNCLMHIILELAKVPHTLGRPLGFSM